MVKNLPANVGDDPVSITESGISTGEGNGHIHHYSCLGNPRDRGERQAMVHGIAESDMTEHSTECVQYYMSQVYNSDSRFLRVMLHL